MKLRKGQMDGGQITALGVMVIVGAIVALIVSTIGATFTAETYEANVTNFGLQAINNFFSLAPVLGTILIAGLLLAGVYLFARQRQ